VSKVALNSAHWLIKDNLADGYPRLWMSVVFTYAQCEIKYTVSQKNDTDVAHYTVCHNYRNP